MSIASINRNTRINNRTYKQVKSITTEGVIEKSITLAAAKVGQLTTRTDNDTATLTMVTGHGITDAAIIDLYWENTDGTIGFRRGMTVGTVTTNSVPIDVGAGDNLPANLTAITAMVVQSENFALVGSNTTCIGVDCDAPATVTFMSSAPAVLLGANVDDANDAYVWDNLSGVTNPLAGVTVATVRMSHGDSTASRVVTVVALFT